jgi:SAM-dependent methyltransferase
MATNEFSSDENSNLSKLFSSSKSNDSLNIIFNNSNKIGIINCIRYYKNIVNSNYTRNNILDITYNDINNSIYKIAIKDKDNINTYVNFFKNNSNDVIFNSLSSNTTDKSIVLNKISNLDNSTILSDFDLSFNLSRNEKLDESDMNKIQNIKGNDKYEISFNLQDKISFEIYKDSNCVININIVNENKSNFIKKILSSESNYSIYISVNIILDKLNISKHGKIIEKNIFNILQILSKSNIVLRNVFKDEVLLKYSQIMFGKNVINKVFASRKSISVDIRSILYDIPNQYSITDKADGERHLLFIYNKNILLLTSNLEVKHSGIVLPNSTFNNTIIDGELIIKNNMHIYLSFDILFLKGNDVRKPFNLSQRLSYLYIFMKDCFNITVDQVSNKTSNITELMSLYTNSVDKYLTNFDKKVQLSNKFLVWYKYYILPKGIQSNEIFMYTNLIWNKFTENNSKLPYKLDGIIYTPINQEYISSVNSDQKLMHEYKLKPIEKLTIDFYIEFEKNPHTLKNLIIFDKTLGENEFYKCNLFVNDTTNHLKHEPIPFLKEENGHFTYIPIVNGVVKDKDGTIINDKTVVEFHYNASLLENFRWVPVKVRLDKTETISMYKKNYGNNKLTAYYTWKIITNPVTFDDVNILASNKYNEYISKLKLSLKQTVNKSYYQHKTGLVLPMRAFHNYIKSNIISIYCKPFYNNKQIQQKTVLDIGIGRGGDLSKYYIAGVKKIVGVDIDDSSFHTPNGTVNKFNKVKHQVNTQLPIINIEELPEKMEGIFIKGNAGHELSSKVQSNVLDSNTPKNKELIEKHLESQKFDVINCQFTIHYMFKSESNVKSFFNNINKLLKKNGYLLITCFDGDIVNKVLNKNNGVFNVSYSNNKGELETLFNIEQQYKKEDVSKSFNLPISVINNLYSSNGKVEYLVLDDVLREYASQFGNLRLVETDTFYNFYEMNRTFINYINKNNNYNDKIKGILNNLHNFYNFENDLDQESLKFSKLNRYYVFTKN